MSKEQLRWTLVNKLDPSFQRMCCPDSRVSGLGEEGRIQVKTLGVGDFPRGPMVKTSPPNTGGTNSIPEQRAKIPHASWPKKQNTKQKQYCYKFNKAFKKERKKESEVAQSCLSLCDPTDCSLPGSSIHGIFQARIQEWVAISFSRERLLKRSPLKNQNNKKTVLGGRRVLFLEKEYVKALQDSRAGLTTMDFVPRFPLQSRKSGIEVSWNGSG